jgi:hypothetical protein
MGGSSFLAYFGIHTCLEAVALGVPFLGCHAAFSSFCGMWMPFSRFSFLFSFGATFFFCFSFFLDLSDLREVVYDLWLNLYLSYALLLWPLFDADHFAFFLMSGPKHKLLFLAIDVEANFSSPNIDLCPYSAKEWSPKNEWQFLCEFHVEHHKVDGDEVILDFHRIIFDDSHQIADRGIGQLECHCGGCEMCITQLVEDDLGHHTNASPKVAHGMVEDMCPY